MRNVDDYRLAHVAHGRLFATSTAPATHRARRFRAHGSLVAIASADRLSAKKGAIRRVCVISAWSCDESCGRVNTVNWVYAIAILLASSVALAVSAAMSGIRVSPGTR
jgi:hypothetical protein